MAAEEHSPEIKQASATSSVENAGCRIRLDSGDELIPGLVDDIALKCLALVPTSDYPSLFSVCKKFNTLLKGSTLFNLRKELGLVKYRLFMVCNFKKWLVFSLTDNKWINLPKLPCGSSVYSFYESLALDDKLLVFGSEMFPNAIWRYSLRSSCWVECERMHCPRNFFASGSLGSIAIVAGGIDWDWNKLASAELYDSFSGRWETLPDMHSPRLGSSGFFMDGKFYAIGGKSSNEPLTSGEEFDLETRQWRKIEGMYPYMNQAPDERPLVAVVNNELFSLEYLNNMVKKYDKKKNKWDVMGRLPRMVGLWNEWQVGFKACGDQLLVIFGKRGYKGKEVIVVNSWCPKRGAKDGKVDWKVIGKIFDDVYYVHNCTVMGC